MGYVVTLTFLISFFTLLFCHFPHKIFWITVPYFLDTYRIKEANKMFRKLIMTLEITRKAETGIISWTFKFSYFCKVFQWTRFTMNSIIQTKLNKVWMGYACRINTIFLRLELIVSYLSCKALALIWIFSS